jgi:UDP-3-O-[3-hydroxymyristoyl] glucosamine N-acyltransferase
MTPNQAAPWPARETRAGASTCLLLTDVARLVGGEVVGGANPVITGVAGIREARAGDLTFLAARRYQPYMQSTRASAVLVGRADQVERPAVRVENPALAFMKVLRHFSEAIKLTFPRTIHPTAVIDDSAQIGTDVSIGAHVVIEGDVVIGDRTTVLPGTCVMRHSRLGADCLVYPNVVLREYTEIGDRVILHAGVVLGSDGFGFLTEGTTHLKVPQIGRVVIEDDVEIGSNSCVDRATTGVTRIRRGTKIDNLVQVAHNVEIGEDSLVCAQVGISGSTQIGNRVKLAGQSGLAGHIRVGDGAVVGAQAGVTKTVAPDACVSGYPSRDHSQAMRQYASLARLPEMLDVVRQLEQRIAALEAQLASRP